MQFQFEDPDLERLYTDVDFRLPGMGDELTSAFRRRMQSIVAASDERDLRALKSLHFEKLKGDRQEQHSIRLYRQWRLIFRLEADANGKTVVVVEIVDYH